MANEAKVDETGTLIAADKVDVADETWGRRVHDLCGIDPYRV